MNKQMKVKIITMYSFYLISLAICIWVDWRIFFALVTFGAGMNIENKK